MAISEIIDGVAECLRAAGLTCMGEYPPGKTPRHTRPVFTLGVRALRLGDGSFNDYFGLQYDEAAGTQREVYGKHAEADISMDVFSPASGDSGAEGLARACDDALSTLIGNQNKSLRLRELNRGEMSFDAGTGMYRCRTTLTFDVLLTVSEVPDSAGTLDFRLGEITVNV